MKTLTLSSLLALTLTAAPGLSATVTAGLDRLLANLVVKTGSPGASATIRRGGEVLWSGAAGVTDRTTGAAFTGRTLSSVASVTKLFTATIVTRLAEEGRLDMDDPIAGYVQPGIPGADRVTIRHRVEMTAGYADVEALPEFETAFADPNHVWTREALFAPITEPQFEPGSQYDYSNTNYLLLGQIIDAVYPGGTAAAFRDYIAKPADLGQDVVWERDPAVADRVAHGHVTRDGLTADVSAGALDLGVNTSVWGPLWTDGGIVATSGGIASFAEALYGGQLLNPENTAAAIACTYEISDRCWDGYIGAFNGYSAFVMHDSTTGVTISAVVNALDYDTGGQYQFIPVLIDGYIETFEHPALIPLPGSALMMLCGLAGLAAVRGRQNSRRPAAGAGRMAAQ